MTPFSRIESPDPADGPEAAIVWLEDPLRFSYLREGSYATTQWKGRIPRNMRGVGRVIGYAEHHRQGGGIRTYGRRFWWLTRHDRDRAPDGPYSLSNPNYRGDPAEAVAPERVTPNAPTPRRP